MDLKSLEMVGVEVLARWNHSVKGIISPELFIPLAEECGYIIDLGAQILRDACRAINELRETIPFQRTSGWQ